jgi:hypothetical protein
MPTPPIGRHGVGRVADAEEARAVPALQAVDGDGQEADVIPASKLADTVANEGRDAGEALAKCPRWAPAELLRLPLRDDVAALPVVAAIDRD